MNLNQKTILITGAAGFIGSNLAKRLLQENDNITVIGIDNMNDYYDVSIKEFRLAQIEKVATVNQNNKWCFIKGSIADIPLEVPLLAPFIISDIII